MTTSAILKNAMSSRMDGEQGSRNYVAVAMLLACVILLQRCAAALEAGAAEGIAAEEAIGAAEAGAEVGALSRVVVGSEILDAAAEEGMLGRSLSSLTRGGPITVDIAESGAISYEGRALGMLTDDGAIIARTPDGARLLGRLSEGRLWNVDSSGALADPVGRLRGFVPSRGIRLLDQPGGTTSVAILRENLAADVLRRRDGWYEVRLPSGETGWLPAVLVLPSISKASDDHQCPSGPGTAVLITGRTIPFTQCAEAEDTFTLTTTDAVVVVDTLLLDHFDVELPSLPLVTLATGASFCATIETLPGVTVLHTESRDDILVDPFLM